MPVIKFGGLQQLWQLFIFLLLYFLDFLQVGLDYWQVVADINNPNLIKFSTFF